MMRDTKPEASRRDLAVVMARGHSSRMGRDKGMIRLTEKGEPLVVRIHRLYRGLGLEIMVVVTPDRHSGYTDLLGGCDRTLVVAVDPGGDTAATALAALRSGHAEVTHFWFHPVDLPGVEPESVCRLREASVQAADDVWRPSHAGDPGHPVVVPRPVLEDLDCAHEFHSLALRRFLAVDRGSSWRCRELPVEDPGVVMDVDTPEDLDNFPAQRD